jgi:tRNA-splicing ligase RtcB
MERQHDILNVEGGRPIKLWTRGVPVEGEARAQLERIAKLPFVGPHVAVMPDVHLGKGATIGSVVPTEGALVPAAVGVDLGCGMIAVRTSLRAEHLPDDLRAARLAIEAAIPHGRTANGGSGDRGAFGDLPAVHAKRWADDLQPGWLEICERTPKLERGNTWNHLGTLGTGNHFVELCLDLQDRVWVMLHSGSRGVGNRIGMFYIEAAKREMERWFVKLPDEDLAYLAEGTPLFNDYVRAVGWAQDFARINRELMMGAAIDALRTVLGPFEAHLEAVNCHHNYVAREHHFGRNVWVTRKGAVRARAGELGIIPGSMGARSFIVRGLGNEQSFCSCAHGAGRSMSRNEAKRRFTVADHIKATAGIECRKDAEVVDETPMAYKPIEAVMAAQTELVEVVYELRQVVCVKG